jgi:D-glycero-D-manno-heptose 1,7-bisphosphate phosphatase
MKKPKQAVILAGGKGSRLEPLTKYCPKPLVDINGYPFIFYIIQELEKYNFSEVLILIGYKFENFQDLHKYFQNFKIKISFHYSPPNFNTGSRLKAASNYLEDTFFLLYGDNFCPLDFNEIWKSYVINKKDCQLVAYRNSDNYSSSNIKLNKKNLVVDYDEKRIKNYNFINIGFFILNKKHIKLIKSKNNSKFETDILNKLVKQKKVSAYITNHRYYSLTDLTKYFKTLNFFSNKKKFLFLDRDGVINVRPKKGKYVENLKEFKFKTNSRMAFKYLSKKKINVIIITNQAGISLGKVSMSSFNLINKYIKKQFDIFGLNLKTIIFCPHHWNDKCYCRKPEPGMFYIAQKLFDINLTTTPFIGDQKSDEEASKKAGIPYYNLKKNESLYKLVKKIFN